VKKIWPGRVGLSTILGKRAGFLCDTGIADIMVV